MSDALKFNNKHVVVGCDCEILLTPPEAERRGILDGMDRRGRKLSELAEFECGEPATVWVLFDDADEPQMVCAQCAHECEGMRHEGTPKQYRVTMSRQVEQRWEYAVWATNPDEAGVRCLDGYWLDETKGDSCGDDGDPQIVGIEEEEE